MPDLELGPVAGGSAAARGYLAVPDGPGPWPGVVALHEVFGLNDIARRQADRLAAAGYLTLAPDLFADGGGPLCVLRAIRASVTGRGREVADIDAAREWLRDRPDCTGTVGVIGFCLGGGFALATADHGWAAAAVNYGQLPLQARTVLAGSCPVVASYGRRDVSLPRAAARLERVLTDVGVEHDVREYRGAGHSFLNDAEVGPAPARIVQRIAGIGPEPAAAADAWERIEAFFGAHLH